MNPTVIAAIIAGIIALISPIITLSVTRWLDHRDFKDPGSRRRTLVGKWKGTFTQVLDSKLVTTPIEINLTAAKKIIEGEGEFKSPVTEELRKFKVIGGFLEMPFAKLEYSNSDDLSLQFGTIILMLSPDGRTLDGRFVGFGSTTKQIVVGEVTFCRTV